MWTEGAAWPQGPPVIQLTKGTGGQHKDADRENPHQGLREEVLYILHEILC